MSDAQFLAALESCTLSPDAFRHADHLRAAYLYLGRLPFGAAIDRMRTTLQAYAAAQGAAGRYHETVTVAYMALVNAHRLQADCSDWADFLARNPELLDPGLMQSYYLPATLASPLARRVFLLERHGA